MAQTDYKDIPPLLTSLTSADSGDLLVIYDTSATTTKKITVSAFLSGVSGGGGSSTTITGILKGDGTTISSAIAGTDYASGTHTHAASGITSGIFNAARLASGTATDGYVIKSILGAPTWAVSNSTGSSMPVVSLASYTTDPTATVANTTAINNWLAYLRDNKGTAGYVPDGMWQTNGGHTIPQGAVIIGAGQRTTGFRLIGTNTTLFKMFYEGFSVPHLKNNDISNIRFEAATTNSNTLVLLTDPSETGVNPMFNIYFHNCWFDGGLYGVNYESFSYGQKTGILSENPATLYRRDLEIENLSFTNCIFTFCTTSYRCNSINNSVIFINCWQYLPTGIPNPTAFDIQYCGKLTILDNHCTGSQGTTPKTDGVLTNDGTTFLRLTHGTNCIAIENCQDENVQYFLYKQGNSYYPSRVSARSCAIQGQIVFSSGMNFISENNIYVSLENSTVDANGNITLGNPVVNTYIFRDVAGSSGGVIYSNNDYFENRNYSQTILSSQNASAFTTANSFFATRRDAIHTGRSINTTHQNTPLEISYYTAKSTNTSPISTPAFANTGQSLLRIGDNNTSKNLLQLGSWNTVGDFNGHTFFRDNATGKLRIQGNQAGGASEVWCEPSLVVGVNSSTGVIMYSPSGSRWRLTVSDTGVLTTVAA